jgi:hypothetical protein
LLSWILGSLTLKMIPKGELNEINKIDKILETVPVAP